MYCVGEQWISNSESVFVPKASPEKTLTKIRRKDMSNNYTIYLVKIGNGPQRVASQAEINELIRRQESGEDINYQIFDSATSNSLFFGRPGVGECCEQQLGCSPEFEKQAVNVLQGNPSLNCAKMKPQKEY